MATLETIRDEITQLDGDLLRLLARRKQLSIEVARSKQVDRRPIRDQAREQELLERTDPAGASAGALPPLHQPDLPPDHRRLSAEPASLHPGSAQR